MQTFTTCLCFNNQAEDAVQFYSTIFKDSQIISKSICGENEPSGPPGSIRTVAFRMLGQDFIAVNGGPYFKFNEGTTLMVNCDTQEEINLYWEKLSAGGKEVQCGWLQDKFGVYWQVVPTIIGKMLSDPDQKKSQRVMQAVLKMTKLEIEPLKKAFAG